MDTHDVPTTKAGGENHQWILDTRPEGKLTGTLATGSSVQEEQNGLHEEVKRLRLEVEHLLDEQKALQRTPQSNDLDGDEVEDHEGDDSDAQGSRWSPRCSQSASRQTESWRWSSPRYCA